MKPLRQPRTNLKDDVADYIRHLVFSGELRRNQRIDQDRLAEDFQVSKLPVREALIALESQGLVRTIPRRGSYVADFSKDDILDHYRVYGNVLGIAAGRAAERATAEDISELEQIVNKLRPNGASGEELDELNHRFHAKINRIGGSTHLLGIIKSLSRMLPPNFFEFIEGWAHIATSEHEEILDAITRRSASEAEELMVRHIVHGGQFAVSLLSDRGLWTDSDDG